MLAAVLWWVVTAWAGPPAIFVEATEKVGRTEEQLGPNHPELAVALTQLARVQYQIGRRPDAAATMGRVVEIREAALGDHHKLTAKALYELGLCLEKINDIDGAIEALERALSIREGNGDALPSDLSENRRLLGFVLAGPDPDRARALLEQVLDDLAALHPDDETALTMTRGTLAMVIQNQGHLLEARALFERAIAAEESHHGRGNVSIHLLNNYAVLLYELGDRTRTPQIYGELAERTEAMHGPDHPDTARALSNLAAVLPTGAVEKRLALHTRAYEIQLQALGPRHPATISSQSGIAVHHAWLGDNTKARTLLEEVADSLQEIGQHLEFAEILLKLAYLRVLDGEASLALPLAERSLQIRKERLPEGHYKIALSHAVVGMSAAANDDDEYAARQFDAALALSRDYAKRVLDGLPDAEALAFANKTRMSLFSLLDADVGEPEQLYEYMLLWKGLATQTMLRKMGRGVADLDPTLKDICQALPPDAVLVDTLRMALYRDVRLMAFVLRPDCTVRRVELADEETMKEAIREWGRALDGQLATTRIDARGRRVRELVWDPLQVDAKQVFFVPDSYLAEVSFAALPMEDGTYLVERTAVSTLSVAAELLGQPDGLVDGMIAVGDVAFGPVESNEVPCTSWRPLPGTGAEVEGLRKLWRRHRKRSSSTLLMAAAATRETVLQALPGKRVVHIATHGFFDGCGIDVAQTQSRLLLNSGLVFAQANQLGENGRLTAEDLASLDLRGTELVVLSACATGLGEAMPGEGVLGMRRAFSMAGAGAVVLSLWSVPDEPTAELMNGMYKGVLRHDRDPVAALRIAQLDMLTANRNNGDARPGEWATFVVAGYAPTEKR